MNLSRRISSLFSRLLIAVLCVYACHLNAQNPPRTTEAPSPALAKAQSQLARGDLQSAEASIWTILSNHPDQTQALALLGKIRVHQQRFAEAEALFRRVVQLDPKSAAAHQALGNAFVAELQPEIALEQFQSALELAPENLEVRVEAARLYSSLGQCDHALSALQAIPPKQFPPEAIPIKAACSFIPGKSADAASFADQAKESASAEIDLAEVFLNAKLPDQALHALDLAAPKLTRKPARFFYLRGRAFEAMNQPDKALAAFNQALTADPKFVDALVAVSELQAEKQKHAEAVASLQEALIIAPGNIVVLRHLVVEATKAGNAKLSVDAASDLAEKSPNNPDDLYLAAAALLEENSAGASAVLEKYVALRTDNAKGWLALGIAYVQQKRFAEARAPLLHSLQLDPDLAEAEYQLGLVSKNVSTAEEAIQHFLRAVQLQPHHAKALWSLGNLYLQAGELPLAQEALQAAEAQDPYSPETEYDLALTLTKEGKPEQAKEHFARYKNLKGEQPPATRVP